MSDLVPEGWSESTYESILEGGLVNGLYKHADYYGNGTAKILDIGYLFNKEKRSLNGCSSIELTDSERKKYKVNAGDILFNRVSVKPEGIGQCVHVDEHDFDLVFESNIIRSRLNKRLSDSLFIYFLLNSDLLRKDIFTRAKITAQASIGQSDLLSLNFFLPPLPEQQKIAAILSSVDEVIKKTQAQINKLKDLKTGMMQELLSPREGQAANIHITQGESKNSLHHTEFKDSPLGRIPIGWETLPLENLVHRIIDCEHKTAPYIDKSEFLVVRTSNVRHGELVHKDMKFTTESGFSEWTKRAIPSVGDVLFTREAPAGESCMVPEGIKVCMGQRMVLLRPNKDLVEPNYFSLFLTSEFAELSIYELSIGTTVNRINIEDIKKIPYIIPPKSEQKKICSIVQSIQKTLTTKQSKLKSLLDTKKALMQDLLTGKVRVTVD